MKHQMIESLEDRRLLADTIAPVANITQRTLYFDAVKGTTDTQILRINNTGNANLDLKPGSVYVLGAARRQFTTNIPAEGKSIKPGRRFELQVTFTARDGDASVDVARLILLTNDPNKRGITIGLRGLDTAGEGNDKEPSLQRVIDTFGLPINVGDANPADYLLGTPTADSDEVPVQRLQAAEPGVVSIRPLALFGVSSGPAVRLGYYTPGNIESGKELWYVPVESAQSVNPTVYGQTLFNPGNETFALFTQWPGFFNADGSVRKVFSEDGLNSTWEPNGSATRKMRFYPFVDQAGNAAPNTYLVAVEEYTGSYDNQDLLFIVSNVKPADATPVLAVTNNMPFPDNNRVVFNTVDIDDEFFPNATRETRTIQVRNTGAASLVASFSTTGLFNIESGGGSNVTIAPGTSRNLVIRFTASGGNLHTGTLVITSNDPKRPTHTLDLVGYWQRYSEQGPDGVQVEPTSQRIINDIFGYTTQLTYSGQSLNNGGNKMLVGDEIFSPYWETADDGADAYVRVTQLAAFHNQYYLDANEVPVAAQSFVQWYERGKPNVLTQITRNASGDGQSLLPREHGNLSNVSAGGFRPGNKVFGFRVEGKEYSDNLLNAPFESDKGHFVRFWPAYDAEGKRMPNAYIMLQDYNREFTNYDFNDNIYLIENITPVGSVKSVLTVFTEETSKGARISFTSPATGSKITGFNVYRSSTARGGYALLNDEPLARRPVTTFIDETSVASDTYYYEIVAVGLDGKVSQPVTVRI